MNSKAMRIFAPGDGAEPPALVGRSAEQAVLSRCLGDLVHGSSPPHNVVLVGPRGNGKTVLLNWFKTTCRQQATPVDVMSLAPGDVPTVHALVDAVVPRGIAKLLPRKIGIASIGSAEWAFGGRRNFKAALTKRCLRRPLVLLLDEAHRLDLDVGATLLDASQQARTEAPFLLVMAGTPGLMAHLDATGASFWSRLGEGLLGIGRLDPEASKDALVKPLAAHDVGIKEDTAKAVVKESQCYPYFIQLWGDALWQHHLATGSSELDDDALEAARPNVASLVADYYQNRYGELQAAELLPAALAVAPLLDGPASTASDRELDDALATAGIATSADRFAALEGLNRLGYAWCPPGQQAPVFWQAGIPSLMTYVQEQAAARGEQDGETPRSKQHGTA